LSLDSPLLRIDIVIRKHPVDNSTNSVIHLLQLGLVHCCGGILWKFEGVNFNFVFENYAACRNIAATGALLI